MFRQSQDKQMTMSDRLVFANEQTRRAVDGSRAKLVGDNIYPHVDETKFAELFSEKGSRPNIEIAQYVSALVLKRMYNLTDENLLNQWSSNTYNPKNVVAARLSASFLLK